MTRARRSDGEVRKAPASDEVNIHEDRKEGKTREEADEIFSSSQGSLDEPRRPSASSLELEEEWELDGQMKILLQLTCNSAYGTKGKFDRWVSSSLAASMETVPDATPLRVSVCHDGGMPVTVSSLALS